MSKTDYRVPPAMEFFEEERPRAGDRQAGLRLGPLELVIDGLDASLADDVLQRYAPFSVEGAQGEAALRSTLTLSERDYFITPPPEPEFGRVLLDVEPGGRRVRYLSYRVAGWFDTQGGRGEIVLARGSFEPAGRALENYIRAAIAWQAASRGGALVHAASAELDGRGYLFYGESGAGKSTLSACNRRARILSDDLSLMLPGDDGKLELVGSPFRGTYTDGDPVQGRFPLVAGFRIIQAPEAAVRPVPRVRALAELVGNLPFVAEAFAKRPDVFGTVERALADVPLAHLHFRKDESYWDAIAAAGL